MKKVLRKSLVTILVLATIMSTLAMFGFSSSAAVEDEAAVMSTNDSERPQIDMFGEYYAEVVMTNVTSGNDECDVIFTKTGPHIIQSFGTITLASAMFDFELIDGNGATVATTRPSGHSISANGYGNNKFLYVEEVTPYETYTIKITPFPRATTVRISVTCADGIFTNNPPSDYDHISDCPDEVSHLFNSVNDPAKACRHIYDDDDNDGTLTIEGGEGAIVYVINPTLTQQSIIKYVDQDTINITSTEGTPYYIVFSPNPGDGDDPAAEHVPLILTFH